METPAIIVCANCGEGPQCELSCRHCGETRVRTWYPCSPDCQGVDVFYVDSRGYEIEACDACARFRTPDDGASDDDAAEQWLLSRLAHIPIHKLLKSGRYLED